MKSIYEDVKAEYLSSGPSLEEYKSELITLEYIEVNTNPIWIDYRDVWGNNNYMIKLVSLETEKELIIYGATLRKARKNALAKIKELKTVQQSN